MKPHKNVEKGDPYTLLGGGSKVMYVIINQCEVSSNNKNKPI